MQKKNYHTHSIRCMHASGTDEEYVKAAIDGGFSVLGFADHAAWPYGGGFVSNVRMTTEQMPEYIASITALREKYRGEIDIHLGFEAEYYPRYLDYIRSLKDRGIEYLILGHHYNSSEEDNPYVGNECVTDDGVKRYAEQAAEGLATGLFAYLAHPDLFMRHRREYQFSKACEEAVDVICQAALENHKPLEYNLLGLGLQLNGKNRGYPSEHFWELAKKYGNTVILGVDAHSPAALADKALWEEGRRRVLEMGFTLTDDIGL